MDIDIIEKLKDKDEQAFRHFVGEFQHMVFRVCLGIVRDTDDADDVTQEVFIEAYNSIGKFRVDSKISTWLYRIAVNKSLNHIRANKRKRFFLSLGFSDSPDVADTSSSNDNIENKQKKVIIDSAINTLPENQRTAFVLHNIDELSYKEIADIMKLSLSSVESLIFRAKQNLQKKLLTFYKKGL